MPNAPAGRHRDRRRAIRGWWLGCALRYAQSAGAGRAADQALARARVVLRLLVSPGLAVPANAQVDSVRADSARAPRPAPPRQAPPDTALVQGGVDNRPFITSVGRTSIGGYAEANTNYCVEGGVGDGFSMELRRFNIFLFAPVGRRLRFLSELEFEHGTQEIAIETAQLDFQLDPALVLRAGVLLPPIGAFNLNHDSH